MSEISILSRTAALLAASYTWSEADDAEGRAWILQKQGRLLASDFDDVADRETQESQFGRVVGVLEDVCPDKNGVEWREFWTGVCSEPYLAVRPEYVDPMLKALRRRLWGDETPSGTQVGR